MSIEECEAWQIGVVGDSGLGEKLICWGVLQKQGQGKRAFALRDNTRLTFYPKPSSPTLSANVTVTSPSPP